MYFHYNPSKTLIKKIKETSIDKNVEKVDIPIEIVTVEQPFGKQSGQKVKQCRHFQPAALDTVMWLYQTINLEHYVSFSDFFMTCVVPSMSCTVGGI